MAEVDPIYGYDIDEDIKLCLQCEFDECRNCLEFKGKVEDAYAYMKAKERKHPRKIDQYTLEGEYICTWNKRNEIVKELGVRGEDISYCCKGKIRQVGGFIWKYHEEEKNV